MKAPKLLNFAVSMLQATSRFLQVNEYSMNDHGRIDKELFDLMTSMLEPAIDALHVIESDGDLDERLIRCDEIPVRNLREPLRKEVYLHRAGPMYAYDMLKDPKWRARLERDDPESFDVLKERCAPQNVQYLLESHPVLAAYVHEQVSDLALELDVYHSPELVSSWLHFVRKRASARTRRICSRWTSSMSSSRRIRHTAWKNLSHRRCASATRPHDDRRESCRPRD